jgi:hypothetical protein
MEPEMTACEPLSINGIQEVSGSIPLISTNGKQSPKGGCFFVGAAKSVQPLTSCISIKSAFGGFPAFTAGKVSGSIPLISAKAR